MKTSQEKWDEIVQRIEDLGEELEALCSHQMSGKFLQSDEVETSLMGLRMTVDELKEQELTDETNDED